MSIKLSKTSKLDGISSWSLEAIETSCIESIDCWDTGGGCKVDVITLLSGKVLTLTEDCIVLHESLDQASNSFDHACTDNQIIYLE